MKKKSIMVWTHTCQCPLEKRLQERGAIYSKASQLLGENVVVDRNIITGQTLTSAKGVGKALVKALGFA